MGERDQDELEGGMESERGGNDELGMMMVFDLIGDGWMDGWMD